MVWSFHFALEFLISFEIVRVLNKMLIVLTSTTEYFQN
jgi:hypothetical protein